jgi:hypothetical protein
MSPCLGLPFEPSSGEPPQPGVPLYAPDRSMHHTDLCTRPIYAPDREGGRPIARGTSDFGRKTSSVLLPAPPGKDNAVPPLRRSGAVSTPPARLALLAVRHGARSIRRKYQAEVSVGRRRRARGIAASAIGSIIPLPSSIPLWCLFLLALSSWFAAYWAAGGTTILRK